MAYAKKETTFDKDKTYVFKLLNGRSLHLGEENLTMSDDGVTPVKLRYLPSHSSAFQEDQGELDEATASRLKSMPIIFSDGEKRVTSKNLYEYLVNHDDFKGKKHRLSSSPPRFYLHNPDAILDAQSKSQDKASLADESIKNAPAEQVRQIAVGMFGSNPNDTDKKIMVDMRNLAKSKPDVILQAIQSGKPERLYNVKTAFSKGILKEKDGEIKWAATGATVKILQKKDVAKKDEILADYCIGEGASFYELLKAELSK